MSPKNSVPAIVNLLEKTGCRRIIAEAAFSPTISVLTEQLAASGIKLHVDTLPMLHSVFPQFGEVSDPLPVTPFPHSSEVHSMSDIVLYLHSSGSTGLPKPIALKEIQTLQWCLSRT